MPRTSARLEDWRYPEPDEAHPDRRKRRKQRKIETARPGRGRHAFPSIALAHGYGPVADFEERCRVAWNAIRRPRSGSTGTDISPTPSLMRSAAVVGETVLLAPGSP